MMIPSPIWMTTSGTGTKRRSYLCDERGQDGGEADQDQGGDGRLDSHAACPRLPPVLTATSRAHTLRAGARACQ